MERFSAASEPLSSDRLKFPSWTLRPSAADAFCSMVGRKSLTGIKNGATRTSTTNTPTTMRTIFKVLFMATSDPAGTSEDWVRRENGTTDAARGGWGFGSRGGAQPSADCTRDKGSVVPEREIVSGRGYPRGFCK